MVRVGDRAVFSAVYVKVYENLSNSKNQPVANNPFTDCKDPEVLPTTI